MSGKTTLVERLRAKRGLPPAAERKRIREAAGASLRDVANELGTSAPAIVRWERGATPPKDKVEPYAKLLEQLRAVAE